LFHTHYLCAEMTERKYAERNWTDYRRNQGRDACTGFLNHPRFTKEEIPLKWRMAL